MGSTCRTLVRTQKVHTARLFPSHFVLCTGAESSSEHPFHEFLSDTFFEGFCGGPWLSGTVMAGQPARRARCLEGCCTDRGPKFQSGGSPPSQVPPAPREVSSARQGTWLKKKKSISGSCELGKLWRPSAWTLTRMTRVVSALATDHCGRPCSHCLPVSYRVLFGKVGL